MTCIAWDGKTLAADKMAVSGGGIKRLVTKIEKVYSPGGNILLAMSGDWDVGAEMREWWKAGADPERFPEVARDGEATLIVIDAKGVKSYGTGPYPVVFEESKAAFGSGRDYAEAAMFLGADAVNAVTVAAHFQTDCGNGVDSFDLI